MNALKRLFVLPLLALTACAVPPEKETGMAGMVTAGTILSQPVAAPVTPGDVAAGDQAASSEEDVRPSLYPGTDRLVRPPQPRQPIEVQGDAVTLRFENAPLADVVHAVLGDLLQLDYVLMQPLEGSVSLQTHNPVPRDQLLGILEAMLQSNGYLMQSDPSGLLSIGRRETMRGGIPLMASNAPLGTGYASVVVPLQYIGAPEMAEILGPVTSAENVLRVDTTRNLLILAGTRAQLDGWLELVDIFDVDFLRGLSVGLFPLSYLSAREADIALRSVMGLAGAAAGPADALAAPPGTGGQAAGGAAPAGVLSAPGPLTGLVRVLPVERLNALLVITPRAHYLEQARLWIERLDRPADSESDKQLFVYPVQNGDAAHIATVLSGVFGSEGAVQRPTPASDSGVAPGLLSGSMGIGGLGSGGLAETPRSAQPGTGLETTNVSLGGEVRVVADERNNALIIYASRREYRRIESALRQLDLAPTQVLIEASIIEVLLTDELRYGLQWFFSNTINGGEGVTQLTENITGNIAPINPGFSFSFVSASGSFRAVINALAQKSLVNVISTPTLMVQDNHSAVIRVGNQQPIRTSETTNLDGDNVTSTIQFKDTGVMLEVSPSVNAGGMVVMNVRQSTVDVGQIDIATGQRSFLQRDLTSRVAVRSGETVILGGLIRDNNTRGRQGVPLLHDLPVIGALFGSTTVNADRTELLVMITPRVIQSEQDIRDVNREIRDRMRGLRDLTSRLSVRRAGDPAQSLPGSASPAASSSPPPAP